MEVLRDQRRALYAYQVIESVPKDKRKDYKIAINDLGANILKGGLAAAVASIERVRDRGGSLLLQHLSAAKVAGLEGSSAQDFPDRVRKLEVDEYMLATREILRTVAWLKRATQATFGDE